MSTGYDEQKKFEEAAEAAGMETVAIRLIIRSMRNHQQAADKVRRYGNECIGRVYRALDSVERRLQLNDCGELQSSAPSFEMAVAAYQSTAGVLVDLSNLLPEENFEALYDLMFGSKVEA